MPWIRLYNDTAVAVDQLGRRKGGASITLDIWHRDIYEFLELRTNNGDDRRKAHDIFPSVSIPDLFMERLEQRKEWSLFDPHEVEKVMGVQSAEGSQSVSETQGNAATQSTGKSGSTAAYSGAGKVITTVRSYNFV